MAKNYENTTIKKAIEDSGGIIATIAERLGCEWHTAKKYIEASEDTKRAYEAETESVIDLAESKLIENIGANDNTAIIFYLKTKGKKRGYIEKTQLEHSGEIKTEIITTLTPEQLKQRLSK